MGAIVVIAAGLFQLTPSASVCLTHCRSPFDFAEKLFPARQWIARIVEVAMQGFEVYLLCPA